MAISIVALVVSGIAAITSIIALIISIRHNNHTYNHSFYSKFEERISNIFFGTMPKAIRAFIEEKREVIHKDKYSKVDACFLDLYQSVECLSLLEEEEYNNLYQLATDLEDALMVLKEKGYDKNRYTKMKECEKNLYRNFRDFCLSH